VYYGMCGLQMNSHSSFTDQSASETQFCFPVAVLNPMEIIDDARFRRVDEN